MYFMVVLFYTEIKTKSYITQNLTYAIDDVIQPSAEEKRYEIDSI